MSQMFNVQLFRRQKHFLFNCINLNVDHNVYKQMVDSAFDSH